MFVKYYILVLEYPREEEMSKQVGDSIQTGVIFRIDMSFENNSLALGE